jgi:hypothetical protein
VRNARADRLDRPLLHRGPRVLEPASKCIAKWTRERTRRVNQGTNQGSESGNKPGEWSGNERAAGREYARVVPRERSGEVFQTRAMDSQKEHVSTE